jgi:hypothetical protein
MASFYEYKTTGLREIQFFDANGKRQRIRLGRTPKRICNEIRFIRLMRAGD